jgi:hypothetical protein
VPHVALRNRFINPADGSDYVWEVNHNEEEDFGRTVNLDLSAPTGDNTDFIRQEGQQEPLSFRFAGDILTQTQYNAMWFFYTLCRAHTIYFEDVTGAMWEVTITSFKPKRVRASRNPRAAAGTVQSHYIWSYTIEMQVISLISGWPDPTP